MKTLEPADRIPPYSEEAERGILGSVMLDPERVLDACDDSAMTPEAFYIPANRMIFSAMIKTKRAGRLPDLLVLIESLRSSGELDQCGGEDFLHKLIDQTPTSSHAQYYIDIVREKQHLRQIIENAREAERAAFEQSESAETIRSKTEYAFASLESHKRAEKTLASALKTQIERWEVAKKTGCAGIPTGFNILDTYFGGLMEGAVYYFSGQAGSCKTTLMRNILENISGYRENKVPSALFSLEQTTEQIAGSIAARHAKQSVYHLNSGLKNDKYADVRKVALSACHVSKWPIHIIDQPQTPTSLWSACRRLVSKHGVRVIALDFLQRISSDQRYKSDEERLTHYSATVTEIAKTLGCSMIVISALSRTGQLRGSGMIDYDAWAHVRLEKGPEWANGVYEIVANFEKQRFGPPVDPEKLRLIGNEQRLTELSAEREMELNKEASDFFDNIRSSDAM